MTFGGFAAAGVIAGAVLLHRTYKRVGRRCECGEIGTYRINKITFPSGEDFNPYELQLQLRELWKKPSLTGLRKFRKQYRWWIRNAQTVTFSICPHCSKNNNQPRVRVVTINHRSISVWHLYWVHWFDRQQFYLSNLTLDVSGAVIDLDMVFSAHVRRLHIKGRPQSDGTGNEPPGYKIAGVEIPDITDI